MPQDEGTSNSQQSKTQTSQELNAWLLKRSPDQALPFNAQESVHINMPPLISYIRQQFGHLGESSSRLTRWVIEQGSLASAASRAVRLPLLSRAFDYIRRKATFVPPMWQRTLDLPWFLKRPKRSSRFIQTTHDIADRKLNISLQPDELYPDNLQTLSDAEEGQPDYEATETYPLAADETYPLINSELLSPPLAMREMLTTTGGFPFVASDTTLPLPAKKMPDKHYLKEPAEPWHLTTEKQPFRTVEEAYPVLIKNLFLSPAARVRLPDTTSEMLRHTRASSTPLNTKQIIDGLEAEGGTEVISPYIEQSGILIPPDVYQSYRIPKADPRQMTQRMTFQHRPMGAHPQVTGEGISEVQSANMLNIGVSDEPIVQDIHTFRPLATSKQPATLEHKSLLQALTAWSRSPIFLDASKRPGPSIIPRKAKYPSGLASNTVLPEALTYSEGSEVLPGGISRQLAPQVGQARRQKSVASSSVEMAGQSTAVRYQTEGVADVSQSSDTLNLVTLEHGRIGQGFPGGYVNRTLLYREPSSFAGSPIRPLDVPKSKHHIMILPSQQLFKSEAYAPLSDRIEEYGFLYKQEYVPSSPGNKNDRQPARELPVASAIEPKAEFSSPHSEELLTNKYTTIPELPSSRYPNVPELALAPVDYTPVTASSQIARREELGAEGIEQEGEYVGAPDIDAIAVNVYGILKRRLMAERERALGVY